MSFEVTILGCGSASPTSYRNPTSQIVEVQNRTLLIDCGEGSQVQIRKNKIRMQKINHIFISHLHGDHYFGLIGLLSTFNLLGRENELHVYGPRDLENVIYTQLKASKTFPKYKLQFHALNFAESELIFEDNKVSVRTIPLNHRVYTNGYLFTESYYNVAQFNPGNYRTHTCSELTISNSGKDVVLSGWINKKRDHGKVMIQIYLKVMHFVVTQNTQKQLYLL